MDACSKKKKNADDDDDDNSTMPGTRTTTTTALNLLEDLQPVHLLILQWLEPKDIAICGAVSTYFRNCVVLSKPHYLWYYAYCIKYRSKQFALPPAFEAILLLQRCHGSGGKGDGNNDDDDDNDEDNDQQGKEEHVVKLQDFDSWRDLVVAREKISQSYNNMDACLRHTSDVIVVVTPPPPSPSNDSTTPTASTSGMVELRLRDGVRTAAAMTVLKMRIMDLLLPLGHSRSMAYMEFHIIGGASIGLVSSSPSSSSSSSSSEEDFWNDLVLARHVGWDVGSIGYHGDNGMIHCGNSMRGHSFGGAPTFGYDPDLVQTNNVTNAPSQPDVVGVGVEPSDRTVFFTKNGTLVGSIRISDMMMNHDNNNNSNNVSHYYNHFAIALDTSSSSDSTFCSMNWGRERFLFDIEKYSLEPRPVPKLELSTPRSYNNNNLFMGGHHHGGFLHWWEDEPDEELEEEEW